MVDPRNFYAKEKLKNGLIVVIRAVRPDDGAKIRRAFSQLDPDTVYHRFFAHKREVTDAELDHITGVDFEHNAALLVTTGSGADEAVIGGASYFAIDSKPESRSAELAFTIEEEFQGLGLASRLMRALAEIARANGFSQLEADVLGDNAAMLAVFRRSGLPMTVGRENDVVHVTLSLAPTQEEPAAPT